MTNPIICPNCGLPFDSTDPRVVRLTPAAYHAWHTLRTTLKNGQTVGVYRMAEIVGVHPTTIYHYLPQMIAHGLATRTLKREGGRYYVYQLAM